MPVLDNGARDQYTAAAAQTVFPYTFEIFAKEDVAVEVDGVLKAEGTDYTVSGVGNDSGGNITFLVGRTAGEVITIYRDMELKREQDYQQSGDFLADEVDADFDRLWLAIQQSASKYDLSIRAPIDDSVLTSSNTILSSALTRANKSLGFNSKGELDYFSSSSPVGSLREYATLAAAVADIGNVSIGDTLIVQERESGKNGGAIWAVRDATLVVENEVDIVTGDATRSLEIVPLSEIRFDQLGIFDDAGASDQRDKIQAAINRALSDELPLNGTYGTFRIDSALDKITEAFTFYSEQKGSFIILRNYTEADATRGVLHAEAGTQDWRNIYIHAAAGTTGGAGFSLVSTASTSPDFSAIQGGLVTGVSGGTFANSWYFDGSARTGGSPGLRDPVIEGDAFAATTEIVNIKTVNNGRFNINCFSAGGSSTSAKIWGISGNKSNNVQFICSSLPDLKLDYSANVMVATSASMTSVTNTTNVSEAIVIAPFISSVQYSWSNSQYICENVNTNSSGTWQLWNEPNGSASNNLQATYNATSGLAELGPQAGGTTELSLKTAIGGAYAERLRLKSDGSVKAASEVRVSGDIGGESGSNTITNGENTGVSRSTGVGTVKFADGTNRDNAGFIKIYIGTTAYYVPVFTAN